MLFTLIGMIHLKSLPGAPLYGGDFDAILQCAIQDALTLSNAGYDGLIIENFGDTPFYPGRVPALTVASMTRCILAVRNVVPEMDCYVNVLRNDALSGLAIAAATGARGIRVNVLSGVRATDQGVITGMAHEVVRERAIIAPGAHILADVDVKHSAALAERPIDERVRELTQRALADVIIVSGAGTGSAPSIDKVRRVVAASSAPVWLGSGVCVENIGAFVEAAAGAIVGTSIKVDGLTANPVCERRANQLREASQHRNPYV